MDSPQSLHDNVVQDGAPVHHRRRTGGARRSVAIAGAALLVVGIAGTASAATDTAFSPNFQVESLDGGGNNTAHPTWGKLGLPYSRVAPTTYADGVGAPAAGADPRYVSNRVINDESQNVFSERSVTQWAWTWGQFLDHTFGLAEGGSESLNPAFNRGDPMETFNNDLGVIPMTRDAATPGTGTGTGNPREQTNTVSSYIDGFSIYSGSTDRLEWLRDGPRDGNMANNKATLMLPGGYLPTRDARGDANSAPTMAIDGRLRANPAKAMVAGDVRGNENIALTATHTLFAREHNRIVSKLPSFLTDEQKFQVARRVVIAEQQFITYNEFLPSMGVRLPAYTGYKSNVNATLSNEFATVGYRAHSMIHGEFEIETDRARYSPAQLASFAQQGVKVEDGPTPAEVILAVPLNVAFFNPGLLKQIGVGPMLQSLSGEPQYKNEEMIDNQLRSVLFQVPKPGNTTCIEPVDPVCYSGVLDLGVLDIVRAREHGIPNYNGLRQAYGLAPRTSFRTITGESSESYPNDPMLPPGHETDSPRSIDFTALHDRNGAPIALDSPVSQTQAVMATRRTPLAARLKAVYKTVDQVDAFTGMISEPHVNGSEFGELQLAIWKKQFQALRDGDRFFFGNDPLLSGIQRLFGIDFRHTLGQVIAANTDIPATELRPNVFVVPADEPLAQSRILGTGSGRCLDVASASQNNGTRVQLGDCNGSLGQGWNQLQTGQLHVFDSKCLSMPAHATRPGSPVVISDCTNQSNQVFKFNGNGTIVGVESGLCLTPHGGGTGPSTPIEIQTCTGSPQQRWMR